jgi:hypothetical protein
MSIKDLPKKSLIFLPIFFLLLSVFTLTFATKPSYVKAQPNTPVIKLNNKQTLQLFCNAKLLKNKRPILALVVCNNLIDSSQITGYISANYDRLHLLIPVSGSEIDIEIKQDEAFKTDKELTAVSTSSNLPQGHPVEKYELEVDQRQTASSSWERIKEIYDGVKTGIPLCENHDDTKWHGLVERNTDGSIKCTYAHEHKDDPRTLDYIFGPVGQYTNGQEISYPWQTTGDHGTENDKKHTSYEWNVVSVEECKPSFAPLGFKNIRGQFHVDGVEGATIRFHSYWLEAETCDPDDPTYKGIIRIGGHMDYGRLILGNNNHIPLPNDPERGDDVRLHMGIENGVVPCCRNGDFTWYGSNRYISPGREKISVRNGLRKGDHGAFDPVSLKPVYNFNLWYNEPFRGNGSWHEPMHLLSITIPQSFDAKDGVIDGKTSFKGFTDRYGNIHSSDCSPVGPDCIPIAVEGMQVGRSHQFRADVNNIKTRDYDIKVNGTSLISLPKLH